MVWFQRRSRRRGRERESDNLTHPGTAGGAASESRDEFRAGDVAQSSSGGFFGSFFGGGDGGGGSRDSSGGGSDSGGGDSGGGGGGGD